MTEKISNSLNHSFPEKGSSLSFSGNRRFLSYKSEEYQQYVQSAKDYFGKIDQANARYAYIKPIDPAPGNLAFYDDMYNILNLLKAMNILPGGHILEVGSGAGWITELLVGLGFVVDAIEPNEDFIQIASNRISSFVAHHHLDSAQINFHCTTLEECDIQDDSFDAILFYASLHHIIDEERGIAQCYRLLRAGGVLGISEAAWIPGNKDLEEKIVAEMERFGTLENPYTREYLDDLLVQYGFIQIVRYHQVNGLFPVSLENSRLLDIAQARAEGQNILTAIKPSVIGPSTIDSQLDTSAKIIIYETGFDNKSGKINLKIRLSNTGKTTWLHRPAESGWVTLALRQNEPGKDTFREALQRIYIPVDVYPETEIDLDVSFSLPPNSFLDNWYLDMVNEGFFWFSHRGTTPIKIVFS